MTTIVTTDHSKKGQLDGAASAASILCDSSLFHPDDRNDAMKWVAKEKKTVDALHGRHSDETISVEKKLGAPATGDAEARLLRRNPGCGNWTKRWSKNKLLVEPRCSRRSNSKRQCDARGTNLSAIGHGNSPRHTRTHHGSYQLAA